jgi:flagellar basal body P-ring formation protein FlgA
MFTLFLLAVATTISFEDLEILDERVQAIAIDAQPIDKRLKLAQCPEDPIIVPPVGGAVIVRCTQIGWRLRVPVNPAKAATELAIIAVRKGELVECISGGSGFAVSTNMVALEDAAIGQAVRVKSPTSPAAVVGTVTARGTVTL